MVEMRTRSAFCQCFFIFICTEYINVLIQNDQGYKHVVCS